MVGENNAKRGEKVRNGSEISSTEHGYQWRLGGEEQMASSSEGHAKTAMRLQTNPVKRDGHPHTAYLSRQNPNQTSKPCKPPQLREPPTSA